MNKDTTMNKLLLVLILVVLIVGIVFGVFFMNSGESSDMSAEEKYVPEWDPYCNALDFTELCDLEECECIQFFRGECCQEKTFCEKNGFNIKNRVENMSTFTVSYAVCVFGDGTECDEWEYFQGTCTPGQCQRWSMPEGGCINN